MSALKPHVNVIAPAKITVTYTWLRLMNQLYTPFRFMPGAGRPKFDAPATLDEKRAAAAAAGTGAPTTARRTTSAGTRTGAAARARTAARAAPAKTRAADMTRESPKPNGRVCGARRHPLATVTVYAARG